MPTARGRNIVAKRRGKMRSVRGRRRVTPKKRRRVTPRRSDSLALNCTRRSTCGKLLFCSGHRFFLMRSPGCRALVLRSCWNDVREWTSKMQRMSITLALLDYACRRAPLEMRGGGSRLCNRLYCFFWVKREASVYCSSVSSPTVARSTIINRCVLHGCGSARPGCIARVAARSAGIGRYTTGSHVKMICTRKQL